MFSKFLVKDFILSQRYLLNNNPIKLLKNNFSRINKRKSKKIDEKSKLNEKQQKSKDEKENMKSGNKPDQLQLIDVVNIGYTLIVTGSILLYFNIRHVRALNLVSYEEFERDYLRHGEVRKITFYGMFSKFIAGSEIRVVLYHDNDRMYQEIAVTDIHKDEFKKKLRSAEADLKIQYSDRVPISRNISDEIFWIGCLLSLPRFIVYKIHPPSYYENIDKIRRSKWLEESRDAKFSSIFAKVPPVLKKEMTKIKFEDIAGLHSAKVEIKEFLDYLKDPSKFIRLGAHLPKGAMLLGPPGCGKTLLVKALAYESKTPFYYKSGPEFVESIGGLSARKIRDMFSEARFNAPCIIFIDEIDTIGKKRGSTNYRDGDADQTLNQLLVEMDGMDSLTGVVVFAATNRSDVLDAALLRPGRFDRHIHIDLPFLKEREEIFTLYLKKFENKLESSISTLSENLANQTPGMSGTDIANVCNEAAIAAAKHNYDIIKDECFDSALERILEGAVKKSTILSESEKKIIAYHEAGHVVVAWLLKNTDPILKASIIERTNNRFGFLSYNKENNYLFTTEKLQNQISVFLAGRAAELLIFNKLTSGAEDDLRSVRKMALKMIRNWGMSDTIGHFCYSVPDDVGPNNILPYSKYTEELIDAEVSKIVISGFKIAEQILKENIKQLEVIATELLKKEVLFYKDIEVLIGPRPQ